MSQQNSVGYNGYPIPVGTILPYAGVYVPETFLLCNGDDVDKLTFPELYQVIGDIYTPSPNPDTFKLPNLVNYYPAGTTTNANVITPPSATCSFELDLQEANMPNISNTNLLLNTTEGAAGTGHTPVICKNLQSNAVNSSSTGDGTTKNNNGSDVINVAATISVAKNASNTPRTIDITTTIQNTQMMYIIKAFYS